MANEIRAKHGAPVAMTITLASLATSTAGVGRQSTIVDNESNAQLVHVFFKVTTGTSPTADKSINFFLLKRDDHPSPNTATDNAGATDAALTTVTADMVYSVATTATSDVAYRGSFVLANPGPSWGIAVVHDTAVNLNATGSNHTMYYVTENPEVA